MWSSYQDPSSGPSKEIQPKLCLGFLTGTYFNRKNSLTKRSCRMDRAPVRLHPAALRRQPHHLGILGRFLLKEQGQRDGRDSKPQNHKEAEQQPPAVHNNGSKSDRIGQVGVRVSQRSSHDECGNVQREPGMQQSASAFLKKCSLISADNEPGERRGEPLCPDSEGPGTTARWSKSHTQITLHALYVPEEECKGLRIDAVRACDGKNQTGVSLWETGKKKKRDSDSWLLQRQPRLRSVCVCVCVCVEAEALLMGWECGAANPRGARSTAEEMLGRSPLIRVTAAGGWCGKEIRNRIRKRASRV
ncbi:unnamed protein product [Tetraodon nigroviridis]|uniref:(spotted green pufferfish) hypothetical protein n=1 Tax=Tetraodon nigroviridis TaxID=99883 RepID=Q4RES3_TETNG|nr:unnamed protein product [Tetraodon nigroviridis]